MLVLVTAGCDNNSGAERINDTRDWSLPSTTALTLSGTDALGRRVLPSDGNKEEKYVGMFYFLWCGAHALNKRDINDLLENAPDELWSLNSSESVMGVYHYWGEPLYGYYHQLDEWVVTRHVEMFVNAGIDFLGMDVTNGVTYDKQMELLLNTLLKFEKQGFKVPQIMFLTKSNDINTAVTLYDRWYTNKEYSSLWFAPNGKPMISCALYGWENEELSPEVNEKRRLVNEYFDIKYNQWPDEKVVNPNGFAWMEFLNPQPLHKNSKMISVSVAQHTSSKMSNQSSGNRGRSYNYATMKNEDSRYAEGLNYQSQWNNALKTDGADIVFVTGWNEWQAIKFADASKQVYFVDAFNTNYSRDIEPMKGGYGDNYYMQTVVNMRDYKSTGSSRTALKQHTIDLDGDTSQWNNVKYVYHDFKGDAIERNCVSSINSKLVYTDNSNRNDIVTVKVATDREYAYFYVETAEDIKPYSGGTNWMNILISSGGYDKNGFEGYGYLINAAPDGDKTSVSRFTGEGFAYENTAFADLRVNGKIMQVKVKLSDIGLNSSDPYFGFKVCDNVTEQGQISDYYVSGDCAPLGRLNYTYGY